MAELSESGPRTPLPVPEPIIEPDTARFWAEAGRGLLVLQRCDDCGAVIWYPRFFCPQCGGTNTSWFNASGGGAVYTFTVVRKSRRAGYAEAVPYVVAVVELDEGPRILTNLVDCDPEVVRIGQRVVLTFVPTPGGSALYRFRPGPP